MRPGLGPVAGLLTTASALVQLLRAPVVGLADNGDYKRVLAPLHLVADVPKGAPPKFEFLWLHYVPGTTPDASYGTTQLLLARLVHALVPGPDLDLRAIGVAHAVLLGLAVWLVVRALPGPLVLRGLTALLLVVVLTDTRLLVYLNSFYTEPSSLLSLLFLLAAVLHAWRPDAVRMPGLLALTLTGAALVTAKSQNVPLVLLVAVLLVARPTTQGRWRSVTAAVAVVLLAVGYLQQQPPGLAMSNRYNAVFVELLGSSDAPAADLRELGLDPALASYEGIAIYSPGNALRDPRFDGFFEQVTPARLAAFYVRHPDRALSLARRGAVASMELVPRGISPPLGTRTLASGAEPYADTCKLCLYSGLSRGIRDGAPVLLPLLWLAALAVAWRLWRTDGLPAVLLLLASSAALSTAVALLAEGEFEIVKHLYLATVCNALLGVFLVHALGLLVTRRRA
ncbi:MAG: hypothetical protein JWN77_1315 [Frankiales bacterium]|jgi:hypothetical protein|nr:hypothetical protein [Frankiales bacterium]